MRKFRKPKLIEPLDIRAAPSALGLPWQALYSFPVSFQRSHFDMAMENVIRNPNINSTVLMRADIYVRFANNMCHYITPVTDKFDENWITHNITDIEPRILEIPGFVLTSYVVRRNVPRNPNRDSLINQTCAIYTSIDDTDRLIVYTPHLLTPEDRPYYMPEAASIGILYSGKQQLCSLHCLLYENSPSLLLRQPTDRLLRIGLHLLNTAVKHAGGCKDGYKKRVPHDQVVDRVTFQNKYLQLKQKYASAFVENWQEKTDPNKHVFEDLGIAAFLIELWSQMYDAPSDFQFVDLGCGNGLLVNILLQEGYTGKGLDVRSRKSWKAYPQSVQDCLFERIIVPGCLRAQADEIAAADLTDTKDSAPTDSAPTDSAPTDSAPTDSAPTDSTPTEPTDAKDAIPIYMLDQDPQNTFYIGNHSDELTLWMPLLERPFMVVPCCSHALSGKKQRFGAGQEQVSKYAALANKVEDLAHKAGWSVEREMLRIPSTRNAAIIGRKRRCDADIAALVAAEGGADGWIDAIQQISSGH